MGCFQALISIMFSLDNEQQCREIIERVVGCLISDEKPKSSKLRLKVLVSVFNLLVTPATKFFTLKSILSYALKSGQSAAVSKFHEKIDYWVTQWGLDVDSSRELYQLISDILVQDRRGAAAAVMYQVKYLDTFAGQVYPADVQKCATDAVVSAITSPVSFYRERSKLYDTLARQQLGESNLGKLVELLRIICVDSLEASESFLAKNRDLLSAHKIDADEVTRSMRLLAICSLGAQEKLLTYERIASALKIDIGEVEFWVVDAISNQLLEASMDQFNSVVKVTKCANRSFDIDQWGVLQKRLSVLQKNMAGFIATVQNQG